MSGRGRGDLIRRLLEQGSSNSESIGSDDNTSDSLGRGTRTTEAQRNVFTATEGASTPSTESLRPMGRAKLLALAQSRTVTTDIGTLSEGEGTSRGSPTRQLAPHARGRGMLLALLNKQQEEASSTGVSEPESEVVAKVITDLEAVALEAETVESEPDAEVRDCRGSKGVTVNLAVNYIKLYTEADKGVFEYLVDFQPAIASKNVRCKLIYRMREVIGETRTFDGVTLYLPMKLPDVITKGTVEDNKGESYEITITFKKQKRLSDCAHLYNVLFDRIMNRLKFVRFNRKQFDPAAPHKIPQHKLEIWPGYVTAVAEHEGGVMLCLDVTFRVLNQRTVYDMMREASAGTNDANFRTSFEQAVLGAVVLTRYNNKTYRIDEVLWDMNPMSKFMQRNGLETTFVDYFKIQYGATIKDLKQPLLLHVETRRVGGTGAEEVRLCFIPELSYLTGLTDKMRADFKIMKDIATCTRITPNQRIGSLRTFIKRVEENEVTAQMLKGWGLTLAEDIMKIPGRQLDEEKIQFGNKAISAGRGADFNRELTNNQVIQAIDLTNWLLIFTERDKRTADKLVDIMKRNSRPMGIQVGAPQLLMLNADSPTAYVQGLRQALNSSLQIVVLICPTARDDRYAAIKRICCSELPIPSQVINSRTLANDAKNRSIVQKIMLQMNCKMGGTLWSIRIPFTKVMICGVDTHHDAARIGSSVAAFVASMDNDYTKWYSRAVIQNKKEELLNGLTQCMRYALKEFKRVNQEYPTRIIMFRDGVGDGQIDTLKQYEIVQLKTAWEAEMPGYAPQFTFIVVQKRINTRIMSFSGGEYVNPHPGTVIDHSITRKHLYDFFLVPQSVRQGTVSPTHYIVIEDTGNLSPDIIQRLAYKLCFLYYNWPGTVRVPACCQYAHKLAFLVGQHIKKTTCETLNDKLFYL